MIYNNKLTAEDELLVQGLCSRLPKGLQLIDYPLTVLSDEVPDDPRLHDRGPYDFEMKLGYYVANEQKIVLLRKDIEKMAEVIAGEMDMDVPVSSLRAIVFIHELGHYYTHRLPLWTTSAYSTELFNRSDEFVLEGWAQLFAVWALKQSPRQMDIFLHLLTKQSCPYHVFKEYDKDFDGKWDMGDLLHSLDRLRQLTSPATKADWKV